jgi:hypothetical protein
MCRLHRRRDDDLHIGYLGCCRKELRNLENPSNVWRYLPRVPAHYNCQQAHTRPQRKKGTGETMSKRPQQRSITCSHTETGPDILCIDHCYMKIQTIQLLVDEKRGEQAVYEVP